MIDISKSLSPPSIEDLKKMSEQKPDPSDSILFRYILSIIDTSPKETFDDKLIYTLKNILSPSAKYYYLISDFIGIWENGGMQEVLLCEVDEIEKKKFILCETANGFEFYECNNVSKLIKALIPKSKNWSLELSVLDDMDASELQFEKIYCEVDFYDMEFRNALSLDPDIINMIMEDLRKNPKSYV